MYRVVEGERGRVEGAPPEFAIGMYVQHAAKKKRKRPLLTQVYSSKTIFAGG